MQSALHTRGLPTTDQKRYRYLQKKSTDNWTCVVETCAVQGQIYFTLNVYNVIILNLLSSDFLQNPEINSYIAF